MTIVRRIIPVVPLLLAGMFGSLLLASSQSVQTSPAPAANEAAKPVTLAVTVRDKHGALVPNLTKDDFTLAEDGHPQTIQSFTSNPSLPLTVGLLAQTNVGQPNALDNERAASRRFLSQMLTGATDKAFLIQFDREVDLLADVSPDVKKLNAAITQLGQPQIHNTAESPDSGDSSPRLGGSGTTLYDAIYLASSEVIQKQPGRKVLILLTDGVDRGSKESLFSAIQAAQRANTAVYAIYFKGEKSPGNNGESPERHRRVGMGYPGSGYPGGGGGGWPGGTGGNRPSARPTEGSRIDGKKVLEQICGETGGRMFEVSGKQSVDQLYSAISQELHARYILGFTPGKESSYSGFHRITLTAKDKHFYVQTRQGYYAGE